MLYCCRCRFGRMTVVALESKLESREKEVEQLTRALEKTDEHISSLETELQMYRSKLSSSDAGSSTDDVQCQSLQCHTDMHDAGVTSVDSEMSSLSGSHHQSTDDVHSAVDSCKKKLKFSGPSSN